MMVDGGCYGFQQQQTRLRRGFGHRATKPMAKLTGGANNNKQQQTTINNNKPAFAEASAGGANNNNKMSNFVARINAELKGDKAIWAILVLLAIISLLGVYSATGTLAYRATGGNTEWFLLKQGLILFFGLMLTYICHLVHYTRYSAWAPYAMAAVIPLLVLTLAMGTEINDARRWLELPYLGLTFQTSDLAKLALVVYVARAISSKQDYIDDWKSAFLPIIVPVLIICGLIAPADLSTAALLFLTSMGMMFVGRVALKYIGSLIVGGLIVFAFLYILGDMFPDAIRVDTWSSRIRDFMGGEQREIYHQAVQSKIAIANGGWFGQGPGNSIQRYYLPSPHTDYIYAIICEEYGAIGGTLLVALYVFLFFRVTRLVTKSPKAFGAMMAMGLTILLVFQAMINMAVAVDLVPVTGLTLPMVSSGGSSLVFTAIAFGAILSVSKYIESTT